MPGSDPDTKKKEKPDHQTQLIAPELLMDAPIGIYTTTPEGRFLSANRTLARMLGYDTPSDLIESITDLSNQIYVNPDDRQNAKTLLETYGEVSDYECQWRRRSGKGVWISLSAKAVTDKNGNVLYYQGFASNIAKRKHNEEDLQKIEWMLSGDQLVGPVKEISPETNAMPYGDLTNLNTRRLILDSVEKETLRNIVNDYLEMLGTSAAVYEKNGDYALGIFTSSWCRFMDQTSRSLCSTNDNEEALACGKWLCHESCWNISKQCIETGNPVDAECSGGLRLYAVPVRAGGDVIGAISFGYGNPPTDFATLDRLASQYAVSKKTLRQNARSYETRPPFIIDLAKRRIRSAADLIGEIVERKQAEHKLRESEEKYRFMTEQMNDVIWTSDLEMRVTYISPSDERILGFTREERVGHTLADMLTHASQEKAMEALSKEYALEETDSADFSRSVTIELEYRHKDGSTRWLETLAAAIRDDEGRLIGMHGVSRDITERKRAEELNRKSAERAKMQRNLIAQLTFEESIVNSSIDGALNILTSKLAATLQVDRVSVWQLSEDNTKLQRRMLYDAVSGLHSQIEVLNTADIPSYFEALRKDSQIDADDAQNDMRTKELTDNYFIPLQISSLLDSAIQQDGCLTGVLSAEHRGPIRKWHTDEESFLSAITNLVAQLFANAERKQAEEALRKSEEKYRKIAENISDVVWIMDFNMQLTYLSPSVEKMVGESVAEHMNRSFEERLTPESMEKIYALFTEELEKEKDPAIDKNRSRIIEAEHYRADGTKFWISVNASFVRDENDNPIGLQGVTRDITDRKRVEKKLRHRLIYEQMLSRISTMAAQYEDLELFINDSLTIIGETLDVSRVYLFEHHHETDSMDNTFEWCSLEESPQKDNLQGLPSSAVPWWMATLKEGGTICFSDVEDIPDEGAKEFLRPQGICSILSVPLFVAGRYHGFIGFDECRFHREWPEEDVEILLAISRIIAGAVYKKKSEEEIKRERQQLLSIFNSIEENIYISDPETYEILYVNPKLAHILQRDCVGAICYKEFQGIDEPCTFCTNDIIRKQKPLSHYWEYYNPKLERYFSIVNRIIEWPDGRNVRFEMATDITKQKQAEKEKEKLQSQFNQAQKMESVGRLAGGVAHDFNNMLTIINGYAEMMADLLPSSDPMYESVQEIQDAGKRSAVIVRKLLAFARKQTTAPVPMNLNDSVSGMLKMLQRLIGENIDLLWKPCQNAWLIKMDFSQIDQILVNTIVNSRDAISDIGKITIETKNISFDEQYCADHAGFVPGQFVMLAVSDNGCGMDKHVLDNLFEPFFTTKEIGKGTGLGMPTVYGIVKQNNGFINVYSEPGQGTTVRIYFPRFSEEANIQEQEKQKDILLKGRGETILVLEDETVVLNLTRIMLGRLGYKVITANSPSEALELAKAHDGKIDLLLTDVIMPEMNGRDFAEQLNDLYPDIKTLFMSGYTENVIAHHTVLDEGLNFIEKPFSNHKLAAKVREALAS